jgi:uncharacterized DUF497 family protein
MPFEWDDTKNSRNIIKHGVSFEIAQEIFGGNVVTLIDSRMDYGEKRMIAIGRLQEGVLLTIAYTERNNAVRIISARKSNKKERALYEKTYP